MHPQTFWSIQVLLNAREKKKEASVIAYYLLHIYLSRVVYLSMFEISSERGKSEKMIDLLHDGGDVSMQHSVLKGLQEVNSGRIFFIMHNI